MQLLSKKQNLLEGLTIYLDTTSDNLDRKGQLTTFLDESGGRKCEIGTGR